MMLFSLKYFFKQDDGLILNIQIYLDQILQNSQLQQKLQTSKDHFINLPI